MFNCQLSSNVFPSTSGKPNIIRLVGLLRISRLSIRSCMHFVGAFIFALCSWQESTFSSSLFSKSSVLPIWARRLSLISLISAAIFFYCWLISEPGFVSVSTPLGIGTTCSITTAHSCAYGRTNKKGSFELIHFSSRFLTCRMKISGLIVRRPHSVSAAVPVNPALHEVSVYSWAEWWSCAQVLRTGYSPSVDAR